MYSEIMFLRQTLKDTTESKYMKKPEHTTFILKKMLKDKLIFFT